MEIKITYCRFKHTIFYLWQYLSYDDSVWREIAHNFKVQKCITATIPSKLISG